MKPCQRSNPLATLSRVAWSSADAATFDRQFELDGIGFHLSSANDSSLNRATITPSELELDNSPMVAVTDGTIVDARIAELNGHGSPEIYVFVSSCSK